MPEPGNPDSQRASIISKIAGSTLTVMGGMALALVVGLIRSRIVAGQFGTGVELDAYTAANGIPELLVTMLAGGALSFAFIPVYAEFIEKGDRDGGNRLASGVINTIFLLVLAASILVAIFAPILVGGRFGVAPSFTAETQSLTVRLMRVMLLSTLIFAVSSFLTGALQAHQHFLLPAIAPALYSGGIIFGAVVLSGTMGVMGLAWGAVIGAVLHLLIQLPGLAMYGIRWKPVLMWKDEAIRRVAILMGPRIVDLVLARIMIDWINTNIGSGLGEGRISALRFAYQVMNLPWTLIGTTIGIAVFPTMAILAAKKDKDAQIHAFSGSLRAILTLALPSAVGLLVLGRPIIGLLFEGGAFTAESTALVYYALQFYVMVLISQSMLDVVVRAFASQQDTLTPLIVSLFTTTLNVILAITLAKPGVLSHGGLPLANGIAVLVEATTGMLILRRRWGQIDGKKIGGVFIRALVASAAMGGAVILFDRLADPSRPVLLVGGAFIALVVYFGLALLLGIKEIRTIPAAMILSLRKRRAHEA